MSTFKEIVQKHKNGVVYVFVDRIEGKTSFGTGFVIRNNLILTVSHVFSLSDFSDERKILFEQQKEDDKTNMEEIIRGFTRGIRIKVNGTFYNGNLVYFDSEHDFSILETKFNSQPLTLNLNPNLEIGEEVAFCGYPGRHNFSPDTSPFTVSEGIISSLYNAKLIGSKEVDVIQVSAVSLSGYSGAPLFLKNTGEVVGMMTSNITTNLKMPVYGENSQEGSGKIEIKELKLVKIPVAGIGNGIPLKYLKDFFNK